MLYGSILLPTKFKKGTAILNSGNELKKSYLINSILDSPNLRVCDVGFRKITGLGILNSLSDLPKNSEILTSSLCTKFYHIYLNFFIHP